VDRCEPSRALRRRSGERAVAAKIAAVTPISAAAGSTRIAGRSDAYGYVSQADLAERQSQQPSGRRGGAKLPQGSIST